MKRPRPHNLLFASSFVLLLIGGLVMLPVEREFQKEQKEQALIAVVKDNDAKVVVQLLEAGAVPTLKKLRQQAKAL